MTLPPLPGVDPATAPTPDDPAYSDWVESVGFSAEGVDRMQIWEMLHSTADERVAAIEALSREVETLQNAVAAARRE